MCYSSRERFSRFLITFVAEMDRIMKKFDNILICTDLDGTLLRNDKSISEENINAIEYFKANGGRFTFVTGRMPFYVTDIYKTIRPNAPIGCINGGGVYDFATQQYLWTISLPDSVVELVRCVDEAFPNVGIQMNYLHEAYFSKQNEAMERYRLATGLPNLERPYDDISGTLSKVVFGSVDESELLAVADLLKNHVMGKDFDFIRSEETLFEILPKGIEKGVAVEKIADFLGISIDETIAIGDYNNDISMIKTAGIGIAVENAVEEAKEAADFITVSNEEHAIAQVIADLETGKYTV